MDDIVEPENNEASVGSLGRRQRREEVRAEIPEQEAEVTAPTSSVRLETREETPEEPAAPTTEFAIEYLNRAQTSDFMDLVDDAEFQEDLVRFFSGNRFNLTREEIEELGPEGLANRFVRHMRFQSTNEVTAVNDMRYARDREHVPEEELASFGKLILAYDMTEGGGTGALEGAWDYLSAFATSPTTLATLATGGWGLGTKLAARAAGKTTQMFIRDSISDLVRRNVATREIQDAVAGDLTRQTIRGGLTSAAIEGAVGAVQSGAALETREETLGREYTAGDVIRDAAISGAVGGSLGSVSRRWDVSQQREVIANLASRESATIIARQEAREAAATTLDAADDDALNAAMDRAIYVAETLRAREAGQRLDPLNPEFVERGNVLKRDILSNNDDSAISAGLSADTIRSVAAATIELSSLPNARPGQRISSVVAEGLENGTIDANVLSGIRERYNLTRQELSYIWLAQLSEAGTILGEAGRISRATARQEAEDRARRAAEGTFGDLATLAGRGISTVDDVQAREIFSEAYENRESIGRELIESLRVTDAARIGFMTAQLGTTAANLVTSSANVFVDMSDQLWKNLLYSTVGRRAGEEATLQRGWTGGITSVLRGMTIDRDSARLLSQLFFQEQPDRFRNLYIETTRAEMGSEGTSRIANVTRFVNTFNTAVDSAFKQGSFYATVDRGLRELNDPNLGRNLGEFLASGRGVENLPEQIVNRAIDDAKRFAFQRTYAGDPSAFGAASRQLVKFHQDAPFLVSAVLQIPFPRYVANHIEYMLDYSPIGIATGGIEEFNRIMYGNTRGLDEFKTLGDRFARFMTGNTLFAMGYLMAAEKEGEIDYDAINTQTGELNLERVTGPFLLHTYLGDLAWRIENDLPTGDVLSELLRISAGLDRLGFETTLFREIKNSAEQGEVSEGLGRIAGDIAATFTYPLTIFRDLRGAIDPESAPTPYTRDVFRGSTEEAEGTANFLRVFAMRATRFLPDFDFLQYSQTYNGSNDIPYYSGTNSQPLGSFNPLTRQFGFASQPSPNELEREMNRLKIEMYELYRTTTEPNRAVDVAALEILSRELPDDFVAWSQQRGLGGLFAGRTYSELEDNDLREYALTSFIRQRILATRNFVTEQFNEFKNQSPRAAAGYIRNLYVVEQQRAVERTNNDNIYDLATSMNTDFETAEEYVLNAEDIYEEIERRQAIMNWTDRLTLEVPGIPENRRSSR